MPTQSHCMQPLGQKRALKSAAALSQAIWQTWHGTVGRGGPWASYYSCGCSCTSCCCCSCWSDWYPCNSSRKVWLSMHRWFIAVQQSCQGFLQIRQQTNAKAAVLVDLKEIESSQKRVCFLFPRNYWRGCLTWPSFWGPSKTWQSWWMMTKA